MLEQRLINELAAKISATLNKDIPTAQISRAIKRYNRNIQPNIITLQAIATATSQIVTVSNTLDNTFGFFGTHWAAHNQVAAAVDKDYFIIALSLQNQTNLITNNFPKDLLTQWTVAPLEFYWYIPPAAQYTLQIQNGTTTANTTTNFTFFGYRVPSNLIDELNSK